MGKIVNTDTVVEWVQSWFIKDKYYHPYSKQSNIPISELYDILEQMPSAQPEQQRLSDWKEDFKGYINAIAIDLSRDDYYGIMEYIDEVPYAQPETSIMTVKVTPDPEEIERVVSRIKDAPIMLLPSVQPEVINCKDCKWCEDADGLMCQNPVSWVVATDCDFGCVLAERREDNG